MHSNYKFSYNLEIYRFCSWRTLLPTFCSFHLTKEPCFIISKFIFLEFCYVLRKRKKQMFQNCHRAYRANSWCADANSCKLMLVSYCGSCHLVWADASYCVLMSIIVKCLNRGLKTSNKIKFWKYIISLRLTQIVLISQTFDEIRKFLESLRNDTYLAMLSCPTYHLKKVVVFFQD